MPRKKDAALHAARAGQILDAAKKCFIANGFHRTSMRQILDAAGISSGGAYNYFPSKDDIVKALVDAERSDIDLVLSGLADCEDPLPAVGQLVYDCIGYYSHGDAVLAAEIYAESCRNPAIDKVMQANTERLRRRLQETISTGIRGGAIDSTLSAAELTECLLALIDGYVGRIAASPPLKPKAAARTARKAALRLLGAAP